MTVEKITKLKVNLRKYLLCKEKKGCGISTNTCKEFILKDSINYKFNYVSCKHSRKLYIIKCGNIDCRYWFHYLRENEYDDSKCSNQFDQLYSVKKRCKTCVDEIMKKIDNSFHDHNTGLHLLLQCKQ